MASSDDEVAAIVMDTGSGTCCAGFAGDDAPRVVFPNIVGRPRLDDTTPSIAGGQRLDDATPSIVQDTTYVGDACQNKRELLALNYPIEHGIVTNWDDMEKIWQHVFEDGLRVSPQDQPVLLTEAAMNPKQNRERMTEVMFETFQVPGTYVALQGILSIYGSGRGSALAVNSGHGVTDVVAIYEGYPIQDAIKRIDLSGNDLTIYLSKLLRTNGYSFTTSHEMEIVRDIKEKMCYTAVFLEDEVAKTNSEKRKTYKLPDGQDITVGDECFRCTEAMFDPSLLGMDCRGIHELIYDSFMDTPIDIRRDLSCNIILSGGNTMFPGLQDRLHQELCKLFPKSMRNRVIAAPERKYLVWIGGSIIASLSIFNSSYWITKQEYEEYGPCVLNKKASLWRA